MQKAVKVNSEAVQRAAHASERESQMMIMMMIKGRNQLSFTLLWMCNGRCCGNCKMGRHTPSNTDTNDTARWAMDGLFLQV